MYIGALHDISNPEEAITRGGALIKGVGAPEGVALLQFVLAQDQITATCLWKGDSITTVADYVNATLGDAAENSFFLVDPELSLGLPTAP